jgi:hypothetical protein
LYCHFILNWNNRYYSSSHNKEHPPFKNRLIDRKVICYGLEALTVHSSVLRGAPLESVKRAWMCNWTEVSRERQTERKEAGHFYSATLLWKQWRNGPLWLDDIAQSLSIRTF